MTHKFLLLLLLQFISFFTIAQKNPLKQLLHQHPELFREILAEPYTYQAQIIYTQINRDAKNQPSFKTYRYGVDDKLYFYPASTVKMPTAFVALEKLNQLGIIGLDKYSTMKTEATRIPQTAVEVDTTAENGLPSIAHYIKKIFLVSDNDAYNRLYEFIGQRALNEALWQKGFTDVRIIHRLEASAFGPEENRYTNPVSFLDKNNRLLYHQAERHTTAETNFDLNGSIRGKGYVNNAGTLVHEPFDFRKKNFISLQNLHDILKTVLFPESVPAKQRFHLTEDDYQFLYRLMSSLPRESTYPDYSDKPDGYVKFLLYGGSEAKIPDNIRIFNKEGDAYGFLTDVAYIVDFENNVEFILVANILVNSDEIFNDSEYDYEEIGFPFMKNLGKVVYEYEKKRKRKHAPDLGRWKALQYE